MEIGVAGRKTWVILRVGTSLGALPLKVEPSMSCVTFAFPGKELVLEFKAEEYIKDVFIRRVLCKNYIRYYSDSIL